MSEPFDWGAVSDLISLITDGVNNGKSVKDILVHLNKIFDNLKVDDPNAVGYVSLLFQNSILPILDTENLSPAVTEKILEITKFIVTQKHHLYFEKINLVTLLCSLLERNFEKKAELFEEIGQLSFEIIRIVLPDNANPQEYAYAISVCLNYATKSTLVHGLVSLVCVHDILKLLGINARAVLPGVSVAMTAVIQTKGTRHKILCEAFDILNMLWGDSEMGEKDAPRIGDLIKRIFAVELDHWKARISRVNLADTILTKHQKPLKDFLSPCIRALFAAAADEYDPVREATAEMVQRHSGDVIISGEFEQCVEDLSRYARSANSTKRQELLQTISGLIKVNKGTNSGFNAQLETSMSALATALVFASELDSADTRITETSEGFVVRRFLHLSTQAMVDAYRDICLNMPKSFTDVLVDALGESPGSAPEIFKIFLLTRDTGDRELMLSVLEEPQWWTPRDGNQRSVLTLEVALEATASFCNTEVLQTLLARILECLASKYPSIQQTAHAALEKIAPNGDVAQLLMDNADYVTDRLMARLQFVDVKPEILTVFSAILTVDGDIADLLSHVMPKMFDLLDNKDSLQLPILKMLSRVAVKMPASAPDIIDRSIHFVLSPVLPQQCSALDALNAALPLISDEEKLLPMVHQLWAPTILIAKSSADVTSPAVRRALLVVRQTVVVARSFVRARVRDELPLFVSILREALKRLEGNPEQENALGTALAVFELFRTAYDGEPTFEGSELEVFSVLLDCLASTVPQTVQDAAREAVWWLFKSDRAFVWALMMEVGQCYPEGLPIKPTNYFPRIGKDVRKAVYGLLHA